MLPKRNGEYQYSEAYFAFPADAISVCLNGFSRDCLTVFTERTDIQITEKEPVCLTLVQDAAFAREEYALTVTDEGVLVAASCGQGVILALTTVWQLMDEERCIPFLSLRDEPRCAYRGLLMDCVRHFIPVEEVLRILDQMANVKLNTFHWVLTNDQGWRIESRKYPRLNEVGGPFYTRDEISRVVEYAELRGIEVIPEIDVPGHTTTLLSAYPEYSCFEKPVKPATCGGVYPIILCAGKEKTYDLIDGLLSEICPLFPGKRIHLGGDEAPKREWKKCPCCQRKMKEGGLSDEHQLQGYFMNRCFEIARKYGKEPICWNESLTGGNLDATATVQYWTVDGAEPTKAFFQKGGKIIYSDMFSLYLDYPHVCVPLDHVYGDAQVLDDLDVSDQVLGVEACLWTEHIDTCEKLERYLFPRLYAFAEMAWSRERDYADFKRRLPEFLEKCHPEDISLTPENEWEADMPDRMQRVMAYMQSVTAAMSEEARQSTMEAAAPTPAFQKRFAKQFLGLGGNPQ